MGEILIIQYSMCKLNTDYYKIKPKLEVDYSTSITNIGHLIFQPVVDQSNLKSKQISINNLKQFSVIQYLVLQNRTLMLI